MYYAQSSSSFGNLLTANGGNAGGGAPQNGTGSPGNPGTAPLSYRRLKYTANRAPLPFGRVRVDIGEKDYSVALQANKPKEYKVNTLKQITFHKMNYNFE